MVQGQGSTGDTNFREVLTGDTNSWANWDGKSIAANSLKYFVESYQIRDLSCNEMSPDTATDFPSHPNDHWARGRSLILAIATAGFTMNGGNPSFH